MLGKGVCALSFALGASNFCSDKTARLSSAVKTSCLFAGRNFQGIFNDCVTEITDNFWMALYTARPAPRRSCLASFWMLPCPPFGEEARSGDKWMVGLVPFSSQKVLNAEVQTFLMPETCYKACNLTARRLAGWWIWRAVLRVCRFGEVAAWC